MRAALIAAALLASGLVLAPAAQAAPDDKGSGCATCEPKVTGAPENPNGWGSVVSDFANLGIMGTHASSFPTPRQGLGNVARTDGAPGDDMGSHGEFAARMSGGLADATDKPGR